LGISTQEGQLIDAYQNTGRFLYKYAGSFLEGAATLCFNFRFPEGVKSPDDVKLKSSMTLFAALEETNLVFQKVLDKYFDSAKDARTLDLIDV
jgi:uncharacterized protein (DUF1810 family)